ncbi:MAG TPA: IPT/TIG domain-containing protein [Candidatus Acidoferrales bacterium]|nr:IPT/TIG domain-containing protein [Candidatus Acidoferrales bacterium]
MRNLIPSSLILVLLAAGGWSTLPAQTVTANPSALTFSAQYQGPVVSQQLTIASPTGAAVQFTIFSNAPTSTPWLKVNGQSAFTGSTPATVTVTADPTGLNPAAYTSSLSVGVGSSIVLTVNATLTVSTIGVSPSSITFAPYTLGGSTIPPMQAITLSGSGGYTAAPSTQTGGPWLNVTPTSGNAPGGVFASLNTAILTGLATGTYLGAITITPVGTSNNTPIVIPVTLTVVPTPPVSVNPTSIVFNVQQGGTGNIATQTLTIATTPGQQLSYSLTPSYASGSPSFLTLTPPAGNTDATTGTAQITVGYLLNGMVVGNSYKGTILVITPGGTPTQTSIPVTVNYSASQLLNVPTNTLSFLYQLGGSPPADQTVNVTATSGSLAYAISQSANSPWLTVPNAGSTAAPFTVHVNPSALAPGTYSATINITPANSSTSQQIPVVLKVSNDPFITSSVSSMAFPFQLGQTAPAAQTFQISSSNGVPLSFTATPATVNCGNNWLLLNGSAAAISGTTPTATPISVTIATAGLAAGTCTGAINIAATAVSTGVAAVNSPLSIPVTVVVDSKAMLVTTPPALSFAAPAGGQSPAPQMIALGGTSSTDVLSYSITGVTQGGAPATWLFASPTSGTTTVGNLVTVNVFSGSLPAGTYNGTVVIAAASSAGTATANSPVTIPVTLQVTSGSLTLSATSLNFAYTVGGASPAAQTVVVGSSTSNPLVFSAVATSTPTAWLSVTPPSGTTGSSGTLTVAVDGTRLTTPGTYNGSITVTSPGAGNSPATVNVTVVVSAGTISAPTATLSFAQVSGGPAPAAQTVAVTGSPVALNFTVTASTTPAGGTWLSATPASGTTPATVSVSVNAGSLGAGQYTGQVVITSTGAAGSPITVPVVLNVTAIPKPVITAVGNAASYASGPLSPGENVTIFGTGIGPATLASNVPVNGIFGTTVGSTRVLFDGVAAPVIYASATQTSVMVPYGVNGRTSTSMVVEFAGVQSNPLTFNVALSAPGIYTLNSQGTGPGAILNQDFSINGPNNPEKRGNVIMVYMTGEGQTTPGGVDGAVIGSTLKNPVQQPVTATIGGIAVTGNAVAYAGSAPGLISGVMQVNLVIPQNAPTGAAVPIVVTVGSNNSQAGVTVAIQ